MSSSLRRIVPVLMSVIVPAIVACERPGSPAGGSSADPSAPVAAAVFDSVANRAADLSARPFVARDPQLTPTVAGLTYGRYRGIRFRDEATAWRDEGPWRVQLFHPGGGSRVPVRVHLVEPERIDTLTFDAARFDYGFELDGLDLTLPPGAGHAGFRLLAPLNDPARFDEVVSFLGASYFRLLGPGHVYGLSARAVALDVAGQWPEEFPDLVEAWLVRPPAGAAAARAGSPGAIPPVHIVTLIDGPSLTGAFHFTLHAGRPAAQGAPSVPSVLGVEARLFARRDIPRLAVAPLTSMYLHGTFRPGGDDDVRPRVHDSEGLLMHTGRDEWIWRPLAGREGVSITSLRDVAPKGFGLVQRDRDFQNYLDLEADYHRRPSLWVRMREGDWGGGGVELIELPSPSEFNDNVVAYWAPDGGMRAGESRTFAYDLVTFDDRLPRLDPAQTRGAPLEGESLARVVRTRVGWDALPGQAAPPPRTHRRVVLDFAGGRLASAASDEPQPTVEALRGTVRDLRVLRLPDGGVRLTFALVPDGDAPVDLRVFLDDSSGRLSETWSWLHRPGEIVR